MTEGENMKKFYDKITQKETKETKEQSLRKYCFYSFYNVLKLTN